MKTFEKELTKRQWTLYSYLKVQKDYKSLKDIMLETDIYGEYRESYNCSGLRMLKKDIRALKVSNVIQYVILSTKNGIKLATKEEYKAYSDRRWKAISRVIKLQKLQDLKAGLDGQVRLVFGYEKPIIEAFKGVEA